MPPVLLLILLRHVITVRGFYPSLADYDTYGLKVAANAVLFVQADISNQLFIIQYAPYNYTFNPLEYLILLDDPTHYVYSVGVGSKQNATNNTYFFISGDVTSQNGLAVDSMNRTGTFIGIWTADDSQDIRFYSDNRQALPCNYFLINQLEFLSAFPHQDYFVMAVAPYGQYTLGFATDFIFF